MGVKVAVTQCNYYELDKTHVVTKQQPEVDDDDAARCFARKQNTSEGGLDVPDCSE